MLGNQQIILPMQRPMGSNMIKYIFCCATKDYKTGLFKHNLNE